MAAMTNSPETERRANVDELPQNSGDGRAEELFARGNALRRLARNREAIEAYDGALAIRPDYAEALNNRGNALRDLKRFEEALESYDRALTANPAHERAHNNRGDRKSTRLNSSH